MRSATFLLPHALRADVAEVRALLQAETQLARGNRLSLARAALRRLREIAAALRRSAGDIERPDLLRHVEKAALFVERALAAPDPTVGIVLALSELDVGKMEVRPSPSRWS